MSTSDIECAGCTAELADWLKMIEIEFSALARQCLNRRIATREQLTAEVLAIVKEREDKAIGVDWQFSIAAARNKLHRHYQRVNPENPIATKTNFQFT